jgi:hypothetical protein
MSLWKIIGIQLVNLTILVFCSLMALEAWWKICTFGVLVMIATSMLAVRNKQSAVALTVGTLPIAWVLGLLFLFVGRIAGFNIG